MLRGHPVPTALLPAALLLAGAAAQRPSHDASLLPLLPDGVAVAVEVGAAGPLVAALEGAVTPLPDDLPEVLRARIGAGLLLLRGFLGGSLADAAHDLAGGGAALGLIPVDGRAAPLLVLRPGDPAAARTFLARFPERVQTAEHGDLLLVARTADQLAALRSSADEPNGRWAALAATAGCSAPPPDGRIVAIADLAVLRRAVPALLRAAPDRQNGGSRFLLAPLLQAVTAADVATARLAAGADGLDLELQLDGTVLGSRWQELLPAAAGTRQVPAPPDGALAVLALDRSVGALLSRPERFLDDGGVLAVQGFLSVADQVDGNTTSFVDDIVGSFGEPATLYVVPTDPRRLDAPPPLLLPGIALAAPVARDRAAQDLERTAGAFALIANQERARQRRGLFMIRPVRQPDCTGVTAEPSPWRGPGEPPVEQGLSPTMLFGHGHVVVASTRAAAEAVLERIGSGATLPVAGDALLLSGPAIAAALGQSRGPIELARRLDEGETAAEAGLFVDGLLAALGAMPQLRLSLRPDASSTTVHLAVQRR